MNRFVVALASLSLALIACRGGDDGNNTGDDAGNGSGSDGSVAGEVTIKQVQNDAMASGTQIELKGVIVTAIDTYGAKTGDIYVEDADGGAFSGVKVFGAPLDAVATLAVGDIVDITNAQKNEFACTGTICGGGVFDPGQSITEVESVNGGNLSVVKTGHGAVPAPAMVDALAISMMADASARDAEWEKWEGVYINVVHARQLGGLGTFGAADDQKKFTITSGVTVESVLNKFGTDAVAGACFAGITGIGDYFFNYLVLPTSDASTTGGGAGCAPLTQATIPQIQAGTATGSVQLTDVYVTAITANKKNFWISSSLTAAANEGVYVFRCSSATSCMTTSDLDVAITPGAKLTLIADVSEYNNNATGTTITELGHPAITAMTASAALPTPVTGKTVAELLVEATGEPYEGVLVTLANVKVTTAAAGPGSPSFGVSDLTQATVAFKADDDIFIIPAATTAGTCYASMTGIWSYDVYGDKYYFLPTGAGTGTGTCP